MNTFLIHIINRISVLTCATIWAALFLSTRFFFLFSDSFVSCDCVNLRKLHEGSWRMNRRLTRRSRGCGVNELLKWYTITAVGKLLKDRRHHHPRHEKEQISDVLNWKCWELNHKELPRHLANWECSLSYNLNVKELLVLLLDHCFNLFQYPRVFHVPH